jgi:hypothetical protein
LENNLRKITQVSEKNNKSALQKRFEKIIKALSENILQHDHNIFANHPGWVTHLCTFALWQQLSIVLVNRHFF